ncbi:MAG: SdpI family protein [Dehalococcoidia bacterium]|nr:SdpI family protein [Dehalococcoidia bacterium]
MTLFGYFMGGLLASATLIAGLILKFAPPKNINDSYGIRTKATARNQETWDYGHRICANALLIYSIFSIAAFATLLILRPVFLGENFYVWLIAGLILALIGVVIATIITQVKTTNFYNKNR